MSSGDVSLLLFREGGGLGGGAFGRMGFEVAILAGLRCLIEPDICISGFLYPCMSSLLDTLWTNVSGLDSPSCRSFVLLDLDLQGRLYLDLFFSGDLSFELSLVSPGEIDFIGGGGAGRFIEGLPCLGDPN